MELVNYVAGVPPVSTRGRFPGADEGNLGCDLAGPIGCGDAGIRRTKAPLLFIAGSEDHIMPPSVNKSNAKLWGKSPALTAYHEFDGRGHWTYAEPGWEKVADYALDWTVANARPVTAGA